MSNTDPNQPPPTSDGDTGSGFLQGVQPAQPRQASDWQQGTPSQQVSQPVQVQPIQPSGRTFTEEDIERARQQEKEKLYPRLSAMEEELKAFKAEREAALAERQRLEQEAEEARRAQEEGEMEVRTLLQRREDEWNQRFTQLEQQREADKAIYERENQLRELEDYRRDRLEQESEWIMPELRDFVRGDSPQEIDASIEAIKQRTEQILASITQASQQLPRSAAPTAPPLGPMEQMPTYETLTPEDIRAMDMDTYKRYRQGLLEASSRQFRGGR
jgi:hypothetical protein